MCHKKIILSLSSLGIIEIGFCFFAAVSVLKKLFIRKKQIAVDMLINQSTIDAVNSLAFINNPLILLFNRPDPKNFFSLLNSPLVVSVVELLNPPF